MESMAFLVDCFITRYWLYKRRRASFIFWPSHKKDLMKTLKVTSSALPDAALSF